MSDCPVVDTPTATDPLVLKTPTAIELSNHNLKTAGLIGVDRNINGLKKEGQFGCNNVAVGWQSNCDDACGELALAKYLGIFWDGNMGDFQAADVGALQVRTTSLETGALILYPTDKDDDVFVLVLSHKVPVYMLSGWIYGREGKLEKWWRDGTRGRPAFFVPQSELHEMSTLPLQRDTDRALLS
jgi:hypothetical protein